ncbi:beta strand repeat-containing protein [Flavobacterium sp.]|uniref:beta strand repeat-containing protein n=1 Tax=Flavobacterium sp. TaxID=239 RepID=UPI0039E50400
MKNSRNKLATLFFLFSMAAMAQVGVGTITPAATLDVTAANLVGTTVDGLLIPRVSRLRAQTMTGTPTSTMIYVNDITNGTAAGTTVNVTAVGFYFFNGTVWERLGSGATNAWNVTGNSGLSGTTNFLGTTDNVDLAFRRNNAAAGKIGATSTGFGVNALSAGVATNNAAFGTNALALSTGTDNVAFGNGTLSAVVGGIQNTGVGNAALAINTGSANTAVGNQALTSNGATNNNTAVGFQALRLNAANNNTAVGFQALTANTSATQNTALGFQAAAALQNGARNTAIGSQALQMNIGGNDNTAIGNYALGRNTGSSNTVIGHEAEFGSGLAFNNTTAIGWHALFQNSGSGNTALGYNALQGNLTAIGNTAIGSGALNNETGANNTALGTSAGFENQTGTNNTYIGFEAGRYNTFATNNNTFLGYQAGLFSTGSFNVALGSNTLKANSATANNVAIGYNALTSNTGTGNVAIGYSAASAETGSNKLYIENTSANADGALIYGEFDNNIVRVNGTIQVGNPTVAGYAFPTVRGTNGQVLQTNGAGATSWVTPATVTETDPQVSSTTVNYVPRWNGTTLVDGVIRDDNANVGIGTVPLAGIRLDVNGKTRTTNFQMTNGAANGYILQSDGAGNGAWVQNPLNTLSMARVSLAGPQTLTTGGWQKLNFSTEAFDTGGEFAAGRFTATKAGFYRVNAAMHTNIQNNNNGYSIGIYVNNALYQQTAADHFGIGTVERSVTCLVQLAVGDYIEVFAENFVSGVDVDGYSGKTIFEIEQIR